MEEAREWSNEFGIEFALIPPKEFQMGSTIMAANADEKPVRRVRSTHGFYMGTFEVMQAQWQAAMGSNPATLTDWGADRPVESVSWHEVQRFVELLNELQGGPLPDTDISGMGLRRSRRNERGPTRGTPEGNCALRG